MFEKMCLHMKVYIVLWLLAAVAHQEGHWQITVMEVLVFEKMCLHMKVYIVLWQNMQQVGM